MKIVSIELKNVKCFKSENFELNVPGTEEALPVCAFVGENGTGKSSILKAIVAVFTGLNDERYAGDMIRDEDIFWDEKFLEIRLKIKLNEMERKALNQQKGFIELTYYYKRGAQKPELRYPWGMKNDGSGQNAYKKLLEQIDEDMRMGLVMYYDPFRFLSSQKPAGPNLRLEKDAKSNALKSNISMEGIPASRDLELKQWIVNMDYQRLKDPTPLNLMIYEHMIKAFELLMRPLKFKNIGADGTIIFEDEKENKDISLDALSDGFKSVFFIAIDIIRRLSLAEAFEDEVFFMKEAVVLIDEIDCHIHPKWQQQILLSLRELFPNCQFIVTTHSPFILEGISDNSVKKTGET